MKRTALALPLTLLALVSLAAPCGLMAQLSSSSQNIIAGDAMAGGGSATRTAPVMSGGSIGPFSRIAFGGGISPLGINLMAATNLNRYMNLRATGNVLSLTENNISTNGFNVDAKLSLSSLGVAADVFPFPRHGFRISPGLLLYNGNGASALFTVQPGTSFSLNNYTYYASSTNPVKGNGNVGLHSQNPAFTITAGWGNEVPRNGKHWSYPVEVGVAFIGSPSLNIALTSGQVCDSEGENCVNVATDPDVQTNLQAQVVKYKSDLDPLKTYPIVSFGVAYSFHVRQ